MKPLKTLIPAFFLSAIIVADAQAGRIVVANDEWTLSNTGFTNDVANDPGVFALNVAEWFTGDGTGNFLVFSSNFGLNQNLLASTMTGAGYGWTVTTSAASFTAANLANYDGIFLGGAAPPGTLAGYSTILTNYVNNGGNVYVLGGTGVGGAAGEAIRWNTFLGNFGLAFAGSYNGVGGNIAISSAHPIFAGVDHLYQNNGQDALDIVALNNSRIVLVKNGTHGLYAVYDGNQVPEPATLGLLASGLLAAALRRRRPGAA